VIKVSKFKALMSGGVLLDAEGKRSRSYEIGDILTEEDLKHSNTERLLELRAIKEHSDDEEELEDEDAAENGEPYENWSKADLVTESQNRGLPSSGNKADLADALYASDAEKEAAEAGVPESAGATTPEAH